MWSIIETRRRAASAGADRALGASPSGAMRDIERSKFAALVYLLKAVIAARPITRANNLNPAIACDKSSEVNQFVAGTRRYRRWE
jgi:hypothetical protein